jgi:serine protease Do
VVSTAALLNSSGMLRPMPAAPKTTPEGQRTARALSEAYESVAEFVRPSAVQISVQRKAPKMPSMRGFPFQFPAPGGDGNNPHGGPNPRDMKDLEEMLKKFFGPGGRPEPQQFGGRGGGVGSGFVYDDKGHILTNNHVVDQAEKITVVFHDGVEVAATVVGRDAKSDVAVIKVDNTSYPALPIGESSKLKVGDLVMAVGSPFELSQTFTTGIISATERNMVGINEYESFLQTDAAINPGNSGGPLVNMDGQVVGVNSAIVTGNRGSMGSGGNDGIGFAIPIDMAVEVADQLIKDGTVHRARIGIKLDPLTPVVAKQLGLEADVKVVPGGPADKAGLKQGDVIVGFAGEKIRGIPTFRLRVASSPAGKASEIEYFRDGKKQTASITPAPSETVVFDVERGELESKKAEPAAEPAKSAIGDFGLEVQPLTPELIKGLGLDDKTEGFLVADVKEGSEAEAVGLKQGDVITTVLRDRKFQTLASVKEFQDLASKSDVLSFYVQSGKGPSRCVSLNKAKK